MEVNSGSIIFPNLARPVLALFSASLLLFSLACGGGSPSNQPPAQPSTTPTVTGFQPSSGPVSTVVTINGTNLTGATAVAFNGTASSFTVSSATKISATVPNGATTGKITVTTPKGMAVSVASFTVNTSVPAPAISGFNPSSGPSGTAVTLTGTNLTGATAVSLNGKSATFTVNSATQISTSVPAAATSGKFSVTTPGGTATSANNFTVTTSSGSLDLTIDGLYVTQSTQEYPSPAVPLVKDRSAWVRVFVLANQSNTASPQVRVQFVNGSTTNTLNINAPGASVPTTIDANTNASWNAAVPASWIQPGVQVTATVDPANAITESDETNNQFSDTLDVRSLKTWKMTLIPVHTTNNLTGSVESATRTRTDWMDFAKRLHPVADAIDVTVGATLNSTVSSLASNGTGWNTVLNEVSAARSAAGATDRYYYGVVKVSYSSGVAGLGFIGFPAAIGWDYNSGPSVLAHEVGHNFGRQHSPCGNPSGVDPNYPYPGAIIGVPGWDAFAASGNLKAEATYTDIMGYCNTQWISDYTYLGELNFRATSSLGDVVPDVVSGQQGLLIWGRIENGKTILEPAFQIPATGVAPEPGPYSWEAHDALGQVVSSARFDAPEVADLPNTSLRIFSFVVPMPQETLDRIQSLHIMQNGKELTRTVRTVAPVPFAARAEASLSPRANRRMQIFWNSASYPMAMLRDARTGEVRGFLSGGAAMVEDAPDEIEVRFSDGVSGEVVRYQRPAQ